MKQVQLSYHCDTWQGTSELCKICKELCGKKNVPLRRAGYYFVNGVDIALPSVTTILKVLAAPGLEYWKLKTAVTSALQDPSQSVEEAISSIYVKRDKAGNEGTDAHRIIEKISKAGDDNAEYAGKVGQYITAFRKFAQEMPFKLLSSEQTVYSAHHKFAGTLDAVIELKSGRKLVMDWKTSNYLSDEFHLQLKAYQMALLEMGTKTDGCGILHLKDHGTYSFVESNGDFDAFLACVKLYYWTKK